MPLAKPLEPAKKLGNSRAERLVAADLLVSLEMTRSLLYGQREHHSLERVLERFVGGFANLSLRHDLWLGPLLDIAEVKEARTAERGLHFGRGPRRARECSGAGHGASVGECPAEGAKKLPGAGGRNTSYGARIVEVSMHSCEICSARVAELRRGRCWGCYHRWVESRPVGMGAACCMCAERRRDHLRSVELLGAWVAICHGCAALSMRLDPLPQSLSEIRSALSRERRDRERRWGKKDDRVFRRNRRGRERRHERSVEGALVEDDMILEIGELSGESGGDGESRELTRIHHEPLPGASKNF